MPENTVTVSQLVSMLQQYQDAHPEVHVSGHAPASVATGNNPEPSEAASRGGAGREQLASTRGDSRGGGGSTAQSGQVQDVLGRAVDLALLKPVLEREIDAAMARRVETQRAAGQWAVARDAELAAQSQQNRFVITGRPGGQGPAPGEVSGAPVSTTQLERLRQGGCVSQSVCVLLDPL